VNDLTVTSPEPIGRPTSAAPVTHFPPLTALSSVFTRYQRAAVSTRWRPERRSAPRHAAVVILAIQASRDLSEGSGSGCPYALNDWKQLSGTHPRRIGLGRRCGQNQRLLRNVRLILKEIGGGVQFVASPRFFAKEFPRPCS
jgi:hypothetical protein